MLFCSHAKVLEALTFCSEIRNCDRFVPILQGLSIGDVQMRVCLVVILSLTLLHASWWHAILPMCLAFCSFFLLFCKLSFKIYCNYNIIVKLVYCLLFSSARGHHDAVVKIWCGGVFMCKCSRPVFSSSTLSSAIPMTLTFVFICATSLYVMDYSKLSR